MSNNSSLPTNSHPQTARDLIDLFIQNNLHIIQTRSTCLTGRLKAISDTSNTIKDSVAALGDVMSAPFLRLGRKFRESPITSQITAAAREFNNELASAKLRVSTHIRNLSGVESLSAPLRRSIERLGLRMNVIKLDLEDLIAAGEADQPETATNSKAPTAAHQPPATQNQPRHTPAQTPTTATRGTAPAPSTPKTPTAPAPIPASASPQPQTTPNPQSQPPTAQGTTKAA